MIPSITTGVLMSAGPVADNLNDIPMVGRYEAWREVTLTDGTAVASLTDFSGNGNTLSQGTGSAQPLYKTNQINSILPVWRFDGSNDYVVSASIPAMNNVATRWYYAIFERLGVPAVLGGVFEGENTAATTGSGDLAYCGNGGSVNNSVIRFSASASYTDHTYVAPILGTVDTIAKIVANGSTYLSKFTGRTAQSTAQVTPAPNGTFKLLVGCLSSASPQNFLNMDLACLFMGNTAISAGDITRIEAYLLRVYGVAV